MEKKEERERESMTGKKRETEAVFGSCKSISEKENVFMCLAATKFFLQKINSGVWFIQTFLQKILYMPNFPHTSSTVNMQIMNLFHTHSQKKQNPTKKFIKSGQIEIAQRRRR